MYVLSKKCIPVNLHPRCGRSNSPSWWPSNDWHESKSLNSSNMFQSSKQQMVSTGQPALLWPGVFQCGERWRQCLPLRWAARSGEGRESSIWMKMVLSDRSNKDECLPACLRDTSFYHSPFHFSSDFLPSGLGTCNVQRIGSTPHQACEELPLAISTWCKTWAGAGSKWWVSASWVSLTERLHTWPTFTIFAYKKVNSCSILNSLVENEL